jgi:hypothetical protein
LNADPAQPGWVPLTLLRDRFAANCAALGTRRPGLADLLRGLAPGRPYFVRPRAERVDLGVGDASGEVAAGEPATEVRPLAHPLPPAVARQTAAALCPSGFCTVPLLVVGEDVGWLWNALYALPCQVPTAPGHRPPLFFLIRDLERLWVMLHVQDWAALLADARVRLFVGHDAVDQFRLSLAEDAACPWPRLSVTVDPALWPAGLTIDGLLQDAGATVAGRFAALQRQLAADHAGRSAASLAALYAPPALAAPHLAAQHLAQPARGGAAGLSGPVSPAVPSPRPLNVLGITSRYTTFLQYSMRDWLAAFERLGHRTQLVIEQADHEIAGPVAAATAAAAFPPDLVVCIDHFRKELGGLPAEVPVAMWVQDALPNLFAPAGGAAQGPRDYCLGFGRLKMVDEFGYPADRYMPAVVGLDERRFLPRPLSPAEQDRFGGEVAFVSHASEPADAIIQNQINQAGGPSSPAGRLLSAAFDALRAVYDAGGAVTEPIAVRRLVERAMADTGTSGSAEQVNAIVDLFVLRVNNALFRHQSLQWVADMGVDLRLWGRGWETHPTLKRFARGVADNAGQLPLIYQASAINLQVTPHGAVHQRLMEGLAAGGFFLIRHCPGDELEREFQTIHAWCASAGVTTDADLRRLAPPTVRAAIARAAQTFQYDPLTDGGGTTANTAAAGRRESFVSQLRASHDDGYIRSAGTVWGDDYDAVAYRSADELRAKVSRYLADADDRRRVAASMRQVVLDRFTYTATTRRLLAFMATDLTRQAKAEVPKNAAA